MQKKNTGTNGASLFTGIALLIMVAAFSYEYFSKGRVGNTVKLPSSEVLAGNTSTLQETSDTIENSTPSVLPETTTVEKGEGLWQVAQRICGDGEKYNLIAQANNLNVWEGLIEGMTLKVVCE